MKKLKALIVFILITSNTVFSTGCWNYREINFVTMVAGMAIDKTADDRFLVTFEAVNPSSGKEAKTKPMIIQSEGVTIFDAIRNAVKTTEKKLYFSHTKVVVINQDIAKNGIRPVIDWVIRNAEPRLELYLVISKGKTANEILNPEEESKSIRSFEIYNILKTQSSIAKSTNIPVYRLHNTLASEGISATVPVVELKQRGDKVLQEVSGAAILKEDKLIGFLNEDETKYLLFIRNRIDNPLLIEMININNNNINKTPNMTLEVFDSRTKTIPELINGKVTINMNIVTEAGISEVYEGENFIDNNNLNIVIKQSEEHLYSDITKLIKKVQDNYGVDIFGFGALVKKSMPSVWKTVGKDWNENFKKLEVKVNPKIVIRNEGSQRRHIRTIGG